MTVFTSVWDNCLQTIRQQIPARSFQTWFEPIRPVKLENNALTIQVPNRFFYEWLEEHYVDLLKRTIRQQLGDKGRLEYQILMPTANGHKNGRTNGAKGKPEPDALGPGMIDAEHIKNPFIIPGIKKLRIEPNLNPNYTFDNFIEGDCNRLARSAGMAIAKNPGNLVQACEFLDAFAKRPLRRIDLFWVWIGRRIHFRPYHTQCVRNFDGAVHSRELTSPRIPDTACTPVRDSTHGPERNESKRWQDEWSPNLGIGVYLHHRVFNAGGFSAIICPF